MVPGGGIEEGESSLEAAVREVDEETGLDVQIEKLLRHVEEVSERGQRFVNFFLGRMTGGTLELGEDPEFDEAHQVLRDVRFSFPAGDPGAGSCISGVSVGMIVWHVLSGEDLGYDVS